MTIKVIVGTETGTAEYVADEIETLLADHDMPSEQTLEPELVSPETTELTETWLICTSTQGAGDVPNNLKPFEQWLITKPDLSKVKYAVIGLGDSNYDTYCDAAKRIDKLMLESNSVRLIEPILADAMSDALPEDIILPILSSKLDQIR